jgi:transposase
MSETVRHVTGGVDTHKDVHVAAVIDERGKSLNTSSFPACSAGYEKLRAWLVSFGTVGRVGVEGTGSYGAGLAGYLAAAGIEVVGVNRPNRQLRRRRGKSDTVDAEAAARSTQSGEASAVPKSGQGPVEGLRALRVARRSAIKARTQAGNQIRDLIVNLPDDLRQDLAPLALAQQVERCAEWRETGGVDPVAIARQAVGLLARRHQALNSEVTELDKAIATLCAAINPALLAAEGIGPEVASTLLVAAGDNPERMRSEASFAALCGVSPLEASSGRTVRHRLNRGGNRDANNALWRIVMVRIAHHHPATDSYIQRRRQEGKTDREILRC